MALQFHAGKTWRPRLLGRISHRQILLPARPRQDPGISRNLANDRSKGVSGQKRLVSRHSARIKRVAATRPRAAGKALSFSLRGNGLPSDVRWLPLGALSANLVF